MACCQSAIPRFDTACTIREAFVEVDATTLSPCCEDVTDKAGEVMHLQAKVRLCYYHLHILGLIQTNVEAFPVVHN